MGLYDLGSAVLDTETNLQGNINTIYAGNSAYGVYFPQFNKVRKLPRTRVRSLATIDRPRVTHLSGPEVDNEVLHYIRTTELISDGSALAIAANFQAPAGAGETLARFASGALVVFREELLEDIDATVEEAKRDFPAKHDFERFYHLSHLAALARYVEESR